MHEHKLVPIRMPTHDYKIAWCRECGIMVEFFGESFAELVPEWSLGRLLDEDRKKEKYTIVSERVKKHNLPKKVLGRSLKDLLSSSAPSPALERMLSEKSSKG